MCRGEFDAHAFAVGMTIESETIESEVIGQGDHVPDTISHGMAPRVRRSVALAMSPMIEQDNSEIRKSRDIAGLTPRSRIAGCAEMQYHGQPLADHVVGQPQSVMLEGPHRG
jgi:hypothetical protein